jgi:hypothetical protein
MASKVFEVFPMPIIAPTEVKGLLFHCQWLGESAELISKPAEVRPDEN